MTAIMLPDFLSQVNVEIGLVPVADAWAGATATDVLNMKHSYYGGFLILQGAIEDAGVSNIITVDACDNTTPTTPTAMAFRYRTKANTAAWGALTAATSTGFDFNAAAPTANTWCWIEFTADEIEAAAAGFEYVRLSIAETANKTVTGGIAFFAWGLRYPDAIPASAIT